MSEASATPADDLPPPAAYGRMALDWIKANPLTALLAVGIMAVMGVFYAAVPLYSRHETMLGWAWAAWNPENRYEHAKLVPLIILFLVWNALPKLTQAKAAPSDLGWAPLVFGVLLYLASARTLQPRLALAALPFLCLGITLYLGGRQVTRVLLFPICCLFFLIPLPGLDQATVRLQIFATQAAKHICDLIGIHLTAVGTALRATDESFSFEIAPDCSGINSLMAITLMTAVFAHLTQDVLWKKLVLFAASALVAIVGNVARIVSIMIVAKCLGQGAAHTWHDISAYVISFPFAFAMLCLLHKALNWNWTAPAGAGGSGGEGNAALAGRSILPARPAPVSYDY